MQTEAFAAATAVTTELAAAAELRTVSTALDDAELAREEAELACEEVAASCSRCLF